MFQKITSFIVSIVLAIGSFVGITKSEPKPMAELSGKDSVYSAPNNFALEAAEYMEYIAYNFPDRSDLFIKSGRREAREWIISILLKAGYSEDQIETPRVMLSGKNIVLTVPGKDTSKQIVVGAHYDGDGDGDNGSGIALLLAEAVGLANTTLPVTVKYVFFDEEEIGCLGSRAFVNSMSEGEIKSTLFMVNIDAIAFGDYCNIYGGKQDVENKTVTQTEAYDHAMALAEDLGYNVYGYRALNGYYAKHGKGPDLDRRGVFTNPWTFENPAPANAGTYSPSAYPASDHNNFEAVDIPYIYFEATNWYAAGKKPSGDSYTGYFETTDSSIGNGGMFMNTEFDTIENLEKYFPGRAMEHFNIYSPILSALILNPYI